MKEIVFGVVCIISTLQAQSQEFTIEGKVNGNNHDKLVLRYLNSEKEKISDTITVDNGRFSIKGNINGCSFGLLESLYTDPKKEILCQFFLEPGRMSITYDYGNVKAAKIEGSAVQKEYELFNSSVAKESMEIKAGIQKQSIVRSKIESGDLDAKKGDDSIKIIRKNILPAINLRESKKLAYIANNPDSYVSMDMLIYQISTIPDKKIDSLYANLTNKVKYSSVGDHFIASYARYKKAVGTQYPFEKINIGEKAPAFAYLKANSADSINAQSLNGKVYLIEFWDLGCLPCLKLNIGVEKIRKRYESSGFEVIGVSTTSSEDLTPVKNYLKKNNLSAWRQVSINTEMKAGDNLIHRGNFGNYKTLMIPRSVLVDRKGNVIYAKTGYSEGDEAHLESLVKKAVAEQE